MSKIGKRHDRSRVFDNPKTKEEMLELRRQGYSYPEIARKYGMDHSTIVYHCRIAGLILDADRREVMRDLIQKGLSTEAVGVEMGVPAVIIEFYAVRFGVPGVERYPVKSSFNWSMGRKRNTKLPPLPEQIEAEKRRRMAEKLLFKTDRRGVKWRTDEFGEWVCLGRDEYHQAGPSVSEKKKELGVRRLQMLMY